MMKKYFLRDGLFDGALMVGRHNTEPLSSTGMTKLFFNPSLDRIHPYQVSSMIQDFGPAFISPTSGGLEADGRMTASNPQSMRTACDFV